MRHKEEKVGPSTEPVEKAVITQEALLRDTKLLTSILLAVAVLFKNKKCLFV